MVLISGDNKICPSAFDKKQKPLLTIWTWRASCGALHPFQSSQRCIASSSVKTLLDLSDRHTLIFARQKTKIKVIKQLKPNEIENNRKMKNKKRLGIKLMCVMLSIDWENHHLWHVAGIGFAQISQWAIAAKWKNNKKKKLNTEINAQQSKEHTYRWLCSGSDMDSGASAITHVCLLIRDSGCHVTGIPVPGYLLHFLLAEVKGRVPFIRAGWISFGFGMGQRQWINGR